MQNVTEVERHAAPAGHPQPLAFYEGSLWAGAWDTDHIYAIDTKTWSVVNDVAAPGKPYGLARLDGHLAAVVSLGEDDDRYLYRFDAASGFDPASKAACPDFTGSHLAINGETLYLCQLGKRRILVLDTAGKIARTIALPTRLAGLGFGPGGASYMISADEEWENLALARVDLSKDEAVVEPVAAIPFDARALAFDGTRWWTSHRDANEIVAFTE
ncbi:MAG: hypothetical protein WA814_08580 [Candidatus Baltobacteraceae bacterium]